MKLRRIILVCMLFVLFGVASQTVIPARPKAQPPQKTVSSETQQETTNKSSGTAQKAEKNETKGSRLETPVSDIRNQTQDNLNRDNAIDLKDPSNEKTTVEYDPVSGEYLIVTRLGADRITTPIRLTREEYQNYLEKQSTAAFWKEKNQIDYSKKKNDFSLTDIQFDLGLGDKIFGEGGVRLSTQGSIETKFGLKNNKVNNPSLSTNAKNRTQFDFDQNIQMNVNGKVGDKIDVNLNYDTEATLDYDAKSVKLRYDGKEDEIIRSLQAGNVSMPVNSSLISGGSSLFGLKTELQFGKLNLAAVVSQQQTQTSSVNLSGGVQTKTFELKPDQYEANRHFFLSQYFKDNYNQWISRLPFISSGIVVKKVELWVINKRIQLDNARNIVAFADMGEPSNIFNSHWTPTGQPVPSNGSNSLYSDLLQTFSAARDFNKTNESLRSLQAYGIQIGTDYERLESARKLEESEYTLNKTLGYVSLNTELNSDEILAVAFEYTSNGGTYQVGEFSTDGINAPSTLFVKLLKGTDFAPGTPTWNLMMKNIYNIGGYNLVPENFELEIACKNDSLGTDLTYFSSGNLKNQLLLRVLGLDRLNSKNQAYPDGVFDYVEGYTVQSSASRIIFPELEPFGSYLSEKLNDNTLAQTYVFQELYDSTLTVAQQMSEKNKFLIRGTYKANSGNTINLGTTNVARGSVKVTAGGRELTENVDYTVDYFTGTVTIQNNELIASGTAINATCEGQNNFNMMRKSMLGLSADYRFSQNFNMGATVMKLSEKPMTNKVDMGFESVNNTIWGLNTAFKTKSQLLTNLLDKLPFLQLSQPSQLSVNAEVAQLIAGSSKVLQNTSYIDDFEAAKKPVSLKDVTLWTLASTPYDPSGGLFPEASSSNDLSYGFNRSLFAWYFIDNLFNQTGTSQTPAHIKSDLNQLSNHFVRMVQEKEIFPNRRVLMGQSGLISILNLAFYPKERGPYNFDQLGMGIDGYLKNPTQRWGGIMRRIESGYTNFEANNIEYIEFWMMDPFVYDTSRVSKGGDLYFNLGDISEDILKDGKRSFENGLATSGKDTAFVGKTKWGKVSTKTASVYAFDNTPGMREAQDVGLDGLKDEEERTWPWFSDYLQNLNANLTQEARTRMQKDPFSPLNDPSGDNYHYYRGSDYDAQKTSILDRYKHYNGTEGNSRNNTSNDNLSTARSSFPDVEDLNNDFTLNEAERYYQYRVSIRPADFEVGKNFINDKRTSTIVLKNGKNATINWYQFKIPIREYKDRIGSISGFNNIRFMRMFLTNFQDSIILRLASLDLVAGDWRTYTKNLSTNEAKVDVTTVSLEENSGRTPINYKMPPGVEQETDPAEPGLYLKDEQSLVFRVTNLSAGDARALYKNTSYDFRQYERLQLYVHAEALLGDPFPPADKKMTAYIRLGTDNQNNYYEYEVPLTLSPFYVNTSTSVWPSGNYFDIPFEKLTRLKTKRNVSGASMTTEYSVYDDEKAENKIKILGNPSLSEIKTIQIGIRNKDNTTRSVEVWLNELRLSGFKEQGGWAALGSAVLNVSDLGTINAGGRFVSDGFGGLEQSLSERSMENKGQYNVSMNANLGKLFPEKAQVNLPIYYSVSNELSTPKYDPLNEDLLLDDVLASAPSKAFRDSVLHYSQDVRNYKSLSMNDMRVGIRSKVPLPIDPANFSFSYSTTQSYERNASTEYAVTKRYLAGVTYNYESPLKNWQPFGKAKWAEGEAFKWFKDFSLGLPNQLSANSNLIRDYFEKQSRDLASTANDASLPLQVSKNFLWNSTLNLNWNITKNIRLKYDINNKAMVEETVSGPVNKRLFATDFQHWKDTVNQSLRSFGTPLNYTQTVNLNWVIPTQLIPILDFLSNTTAQYNVQYDWNKSAYSSGQQKLGNTISNQRAITFNSSANLVTLYNKWSFLATVNKTFDLPKPVKSKGPKIDPLTGDTLPDNKGENTRMVLRRYDTSLKLIADSAMPVKHNLATKRVYAVAVDSSGKNIPIRMRIIDDDNVVVMGVSNGPVKLKVLQKPSIETVKWYRPVSTVARLLMSVRTITVNVARDDAMIVPGFNPGSGLFGSSEGYGTAPGWDFALGLQNAGYLQRAYDKKWLNDSIVSPAGITGNTDVGIKASLEPLRGVKIELNAIRTWKSNTQIQYMFEGMPQNRTGSFTMTTVALASAFETPSAKNAYASAAFNRLLENRTIIRRRLEQSMNGITYPTGGFLTNSILAGQPFDPTVGTYSENSGDVLIPAFLAAYTGKNASKSSLNIFPAISAMLPNWSFSYDGLSNMEYFKRFVKNFTLRHAYTCTYMVNSFNTFNSWIEATDGLGFVKDVLTNKPVPTSMYDVGSVLLTESFNPLFGVQATMGNGWTFRSDMNKNRTVTLSVSGGQVVESNQNVFSFSTSYRIADFHPWGILSMSKIKNDLSLTGNISYKNMFNLLRKIRENYTQASSGNKTFSLELQGEYTVSRNLDMTFFYNLESSIPLVSSYPVRSSDFGFSMRFKLNR